jgi:hypothetical protein
MSSSSVSGSGRQRRGVQQQQQTRPAVIKRPLIVLCPNCKRAMQVVKAEHIAFTPDLVDVSYFCGSCKTQIKRAIKAD